MGAERCSARYRCGVVALLPRRLSCAGQVSLPRLMVEMFVVTVVRLSTAHMRAIGTAGAAVTIKRHGVGYWRGLPQAKRWRGRRPVSLVVDLATGQFDAARAARTPDGETDHASRPTRPIAVTTP